MEALSLSSTSQLMGLSWDKNFGYEAPEHIILIIAHA
jgi:hypothetical protein